MKSLFPIENIYISPRSFDEFQFFAKAKHYISFSMSEDKHSLERSRCFLQANVNTR